MFLSLTAIDAQTQHRQFSCWLTTLEQCFDFLSAITKQGSQLIQAHVVEDNQRTQLPIEAFDGEIFTPPIKQLAKQWRLSLRQTRRITPKADAWLLDLIRHRLTLTDAQLRQTHQTINRLEQSLQQVQRHRSSPRQTRIIDHVDSILRTQQSYLIVVQAQHSKTINRLAQLEAN